MPPILLSQPTPADWLAHAAVLHKLWLDSAGTHGQRADLSGRDASGRTIAAADWRGAILKNVNFADCTFAAPDFRPAPFGPSGETPTELDFANCQRANLDRAQFQRAILNGADFRGSSLALADFQGAELRDAHFQNAPFAAFGNRDMLRNAKLDSAHLNGANLVGMDLEGTQLTSTDLSNADLRQATNIRFDSTRIRGAALTPYKAATVQWLTALWNCTALPRTDDRWSILRRNYSGAYFVINLIFFAIFLLPLIAKAAFWVGMAKVEEVAEPAVRHWTAEGKELAQKARTTFVDRLKHDNDAVKQQAADTTQWLTRLDDALKAYEDSGFAPEQAKVVRQLVRELNEQLLEVTFATDAQTQFLVLRLDRWAAKADQNTIRWHETTVLGKLFQADQGKRYMLLAGLMFAYNVVRGFLTYFVAPLRDEEERTGYTPGDWSCWVMYGFHYWFLNWFKYVSYLTSLFTVWKLWPLLNQHLWVPVL